MQKLIRVVGAVFIKDGTFLAFRRKQGKSMEGHWEFPGGKIEPGETAEEALEREIREELGVGTTVRDKVTTTVHEYPFATIELTTFVCSLESQDFRLSDHDAVQWVNPQQAELLDWAPADVPAVEILKHRIAGQSPITIDDGALPMGVYETPVTTRISERMELTKQQSQYVGIATARDKDINSERYYSAVGRTLSERLQARLRDLDSPADRVALINSLAKILDAEESIEEEEMLYAIYNTGAGEPPQLPKHSLAASALFTNAAGETNMAREISKEISTADSVDLLCAFIKQSGLVVLRPQLEYLRDHNIPLRVLTSTYCGATEEFAVRRLVEDYGAQVKISYETDKTRLHAKAWMFHRKSGFDTAFVGSSNLSNYALVSGWEWNIRGTASATPEVLDKFEQTFEQYWFDKQFKLFNPETDSDMLQRALEKASWTGRGRGDVATPLDIAGLRMEPKPYQQEMLEALHAEREQKNRHENLLVAATGTGKTVVAALDYRNLSEQWKRKPRLLFMAHRKEILQHALKTYRAALQSSDFGELLVDGQSPQQWDHVFASIQSLSPGRMEKIAPDHFDILVIDEFHHAEAATYQRILQHFRPKELLGLTATPERGDGQNVKSYFDDHVAFELRLWDALSLQLLAPLHYFGINDGTDLSRLSWNRSAKDYDQGELSEFYIKQAEKRTKFIISQLNKRIDLARMKAIGFCVSVAHAEYMASQFNAFGLPAVAVTGATSAEERKKAIEDLSEGTIKVIFAVDIFNEGVDIPSVNALILLRPTQSPVLFAQQLGRGLRLSPGKDVCSVFDFIGQQHEEFDFEARLKVLTKSRGKRIEKDVEEGFPKTPPGSMIDLDRVSTEQILANLRRSARNSLKRVRELVREMKTKDLQEFLEETGMSLGDVYRSKDMQWTALLREAKMYPSADKISGEEKFLLGRARAFLHVNDAERKQAYLQLLRDHSLSESTLTPTMRIYARMLIFAIWGNAQRTVPQTMDEALQTLRRFTSFEFELNQVLEVALGQSRANPDETGFSVLKSHADYSLGELIGALDSADVSQAGSLPREGVRYFADRNVDLFLVTFHKDEEADSTTNYHDFPKSPELMHWESQSQATLKSATVQRYIHHKQQDSTILMATRYKKKNELGIATAYTLLGSVDYVSHRGEKPVQFDWRLARAMPESLFQEVRYLAG